MFLAELFDGYPWTLSTGLPRDMLYFAAFAGIGSFVYEANRSRLISAAHLQQIEAEMRVRRGLEEQLEHLIETSPVAILSADGDGRILLANEAAHRLFGTSADTFKGTPIDRLLPAFATVPHLGDRNRGIRTLMQCKGHRADHSLFIADVWFSTYQTSLGPRISAMVVDSSEDFRDREEDAFSNSSSDPASSSPHSPTRSATSAAPSPWSTRTSSAPPASPTTPTSRPSAPSSSPSKRSPPWSFREASEFAASIPLGSFLEELRIVVEPTLLEADIAVHWDLPNTLPTVWADRHNLTQVFLNLVRNSTHALGDTPSPSLTFQVTETPTHVCVAVLDNGPGVAHPELLFRPFQPHTGSSGLGLCISRSLMRSFHGELDYQPSSARRHLRRQTLEVLQRPG